MADFIIVHSIKIAKEFTQENFDYLTTLGPKFRIRKRTYQVCQCSCGNIIAPRIEDIKTKSCGCLSKKKTSERTIQRNTTHGKSKIPEYAIWNTMIQRCYNKNCNHYYMYGDRGITVCDRWKNSFINFFEDMGPRPSKSHSIERIDNSQNYCPENCKWETAKNQARNRRTNKLLTFNGKTKCLAEWAEETGLNYGTINHRIIKLGWSVEKALTTPSRKFNTC